MEMYSEEEIRKKYRHFSERKMPFEDKIVEVLPSNKAYYSERWGFLKSIYLVTSKGYYLTYDDICGDNSFCDEDTQPYDMFLKGVIMCAYSYAFNAEMEETIHYIERLLSVGNITVIKYIKGKYQGGYSFKFSLPWYSWLPKDSRDN